LGFEHRLEQLYRRFERGEISLGYFAQEMGLGLRDLYAVLEERGWPTSSILPSQLAEVRAKQS
jgi:predicted HTH domain antitoxin